MDTKVHNAPFIAGMGADAPSPQTSVPRLLTPEQFWRHFGGAIGRGAIYEMIRQNRIRHIRIGRKILITQDEVIDFPRREMERA